MVDRAAGKTKRWFISNAPVGHYCYEYPSALQEQRGNVGAKVFFYRAQLYTGTVKLNTKLYKDYAWISRFFHLFYWNNMWRISYLVCRDEVFEYFDKDTAEYIHYILPE